MKKFLLLLLVFGLVFCGIVAGAIESNSHDDDFEALRSIPYLTWVPTGKNSDKSGVSVNKRDQACKGINVFCSRNESAAHLMDMSGRILHTWSADLVDGDSWQYAEVLPNGDLLAMVKEYMLMRLDWNSNILWARSGRFHHDFDVAENGDIIAICRKDDYVDYKNIKGIILNDYLLILSPDGKIKREISLFDVLKDEITDEAAKKIRAVIDKKENIKTVAEQMDKDTFLIKESNDQDIIHTNTVEEVYRDVKGFCKKGDLLISMRNLDMIGILDLDTEKLVWKWGPGTIEAQHHPTLLENGNILIFDNGNHRGYSRVIELNPLTLRIEWEYVSTPPEDFYSPSGGSNQRLPNGNTLIADRSRIFEVTPKGEIVWEFFNPLVKHRNRASIYRFMRIIDPENYRHIRNLRG
jgi:hypothetical protein